ncbi:MAG: ATP-grasp domain-containing protein [Kofleriaceae bacterium]
MSRILITGAGGAAAVALIERLTAVGHDVFSADMSPYAAGLFLVVAERRLLIPPASATDFIGRLVALCKRHAIDLLIPTVDAELVPVALAQRRFAEVGARVLVAPVAALRLCLDKLSLVRTVAPIAPVPRTELLGEGSLDATWKYPVIVKPRTGSGGRGVVLVESAEELARVPRSPDLMVQEYACGEEYSVDVLATQLGRVVAAVPRVRLKVDSGVAVAARSVHAADLEELAERIASVVGLTGVANIQFRRDRSGRPLLLEINPRFPGTMPLTVAAGVDMPVYAVRDILGRRCRRSPRFAEVAMVRTWRETFLPTAELAALTDIEFDVAAVAAS